MKKLLSGASLQDALLKRHLGRKISAFFVLFLITSAYSFAQTRFIQAPPLSTGTSGSSRAPNGSVDFQRTSIIYLGSEMPGIPANTNITTVGFKISTPATTAASGTIKIYMVNTADVNNTRGNTWATILTTPTAMQLVYNGNLTIPTTAGFYDITLQTPFLFTGGNFYLAYEWNATTKSTASAIYDANTDITGSPLLTATGTSLPATLTGTSTFRPVLHIGYTPPANDLSVAAVYALGKVPNLSVTNPTVARAAIINTGSNTKTNVTVNLAVSGANTFATTATIPSILGGDTAYVTFPGYSVTATGTNTLTVTVPADDFAGNNSKTFSQIVTTGEMSHAEGNPPVHTTALRPIAPNGTLVAKFNVNGSINMPSVNMMISFHTANVGQTIYAVLLNSSGTQIARSADFSPVTTDLSTMHNFIFTTPVTLTAGDYYVGMAAVASATTYFPLGVQTEEPVRPNTFYTTPIAGGTPVKLTSNYRLIIEPVLSTCLVPATPTVTPAGTALFCTGGSVTLTATTTTTGVTYQWYRNGSPIAGATGATTAVSTAGNYTVVAVSGACNSGVSNIVAASNGSPSAPAITAGGPTTFCQNGTVILSGTSPTTGVTYQWNLDGTAIAGATTTSYTATASGNYTLTAIAGGVCNAVSNAITVTVTPAPPTPVISQNGGTLTSSVATGNQWFFNGLPLAGATGQTLVTTANGAYTVQASANGCDSPMSNLVNVTNTGINDNMAGMSVQVYPNPASGTFKIKLNGYQEDAKATLYTLTGQQVKVATVKANEEKTIETKGLATGTYLLKLTSDKGVQVTRLIIE